MILSFQKYLFLTHATHGGVLMAEKAFPFAPGNIVETLIGTTRIDKVSVVRVTNTNGIHVMKIVSQGYRPGDTSIYSLPRGADPLGDNWNQIIKDPIAEKHRHVCTSAFRFARM